MATNVIITFKTKPEKLAEFKEILKSVKSDLPTVSGCKGVQIFRSTKNSNTFTLVESWDSEESHKKHIKGVIESGTWETITSHLECDPDSSYYTEI
jgi:quinol monooxygenase YgiN